MVLRGELLLDDVFPGREHRRPPRRGRGLELVCFALRVRPRQCVVAHTKGKERAGMLLEGWV